MNSSNRLTADDWAKAALDVIAAAGVDQVTVEGLGRDLGVTKGSFYWHFANRQALITAALDLWERRATIEVIEQLMKIVDPVARLRVLFEISLGDAVDGPLDAALVASVNDPVVGVTVRSVTRRRIEFLEQLFTDMALSASEAGIRARIAYSAYVGHFLVSRALDDAVDLDGFLNGYIDQLVASLAADSPTSGGRRISCWVRP
ncbi:TetR/AcrR family transcriptional regulator [Arthrobacter sp. H20]|uniref:TetR/AcrR family transcriptional regulator n=1 Tax=Arthrobacter sp. H20 TaxID=1267981 RepID=UPI00138AE0A9|nr:TetR/AcrR family transcriptional regulator [Arthrobacter sp. H20]